VFGHLTQGGMETWLLSVYNRINRSAVVFDIVVSTDEEHPLNKPFRELGARIFPTAKIRYPLRFVHRFLGVLKEHGHYDSVHSHIGALSGIVVLLAALMGVKQRIVHAHSSYEERSVPLVSRLYPAVSLVLKRLIRAFATKGLAASREAAEFLYGPDWNTDSRFAVLYCGIDLDRFERTRNVTETRRALGIPSGARVVGHVGSFRTPKNHAFLVKIAREVIRRGNDVWFLLVGDGELRTEIEHLAKRLKVDDRLVFTGMRPDVPDLLAAMDCFVFPSLYEGLGLVLLEAQASGLPCIVSLRVPNEADVVHNLVTRLDLEDGVEVWSKTIIDALEKPRLSRADALVIMHESAMNIEHSVQALVDIYINEPDAG